MAKRSSSLLALFHKACSCLSKPSAFSSRLYPKSSLGPYGDRYPSMNSPFFCSLLLSNYPQSNTQLRYSTCRPWLFSVSQCLRGGFVVATLCRCTLSQTPPRHRRFIENKRQTPI